MFNSKFNTTTTHPGASASSLQAHLKQAEAVLFRPRPMRACSCINIHGCSYILLAFVVLSISVPQGSALSRTGARHYAVTWAKQAALIRPFGSNHAYTLQAYLTIYGIMC